MFKFILILIFIIGTVTTVRPIRNRVFPVFEPVIVKLGPAGEKILAPIRKWKAQNGASTVVKLLTQYRTQGKQLPNPQNFSSWLQRTVPDDSAAFDPWGQRYYLKSGRNTLSVGSPGPDGMKDTADDIIVTAPWD